MGKRSRRRDGADGASSSAEPVGTPPGSDAGAGSAPATRFGSRSDARPKAPWHPFPLVELCGLAGLVLLGIGVFSLGDDRGAVLIGCGLVLGSLAGLDTVVREHLAGFRSHSLLLAGVPTLLLAAALYLVRAPLLVLPVVAVVTFVAAFVTLRRAFRRRSGGLAFR